MQHKAHLENEPVPNHGEVFEEYYFIEKIEVRYGDISTAACTVCFITGELISGTGGGEGISVDLYNRIKSGSVKVIDETGKVLNPRPQN